MKQSKHGARRLWLARFALVALFAVVTAPRPGAAQEGNPSPPPPADSTFEDGPRSLEPAPPATNPAAPGVTPYLRGTPAFTWGDSTGLVLPPLADVRSRSETALDRDASRTLRSTVESRMLKARERSVRWKSQVEIQKSKIQALNKQIDVARKEKREADRKDFEAEKRREEKVRGYFDAMRQALEAEADFHKATLDYAQARLAEVEIEGRLAERWGSGGYESRISGDARDLERRVLLAVKDRADRMSTHAAREKTLSDRRLDALKAWNELQK
ncbi:MAG: hypothetical protein ABIP29_06630 [Candidatus Eisenbacteria bacterium]